MQGFLGCIKFLHFIGAGCRKMKKQIIEIFILNYFYQRPDTPLLYGQVFLECRKACPEAATRTIRDHFDKLRDKGFLKKKKHDLYCLPNRKTKDGKQYNNESFSKRIINEYDLVKLSIKKRCIIHPRECENILFFPPSKDGMIRPRNDAFNKAVNAYYSNRKKDKKGIAQSLFFKIMDTIGFHSADDLQEKKEIIKELQEFTKEIDINLKELSKNSQAYFLLSETKEYLEFSLIGLELLIRNKK
jgi:hypothetical protein